MFGILLKDGSKILSPTLPHTSMVLMLLELGESAVVDGQAKFDS